MLANKISPASLLSSNSSTRQQTEMQGLSSSLEGETNSQHSQASLFACGSQPASSLELFSEPSNSLSSSCHSQQSQGDLLHHNTRSDTHSQSQDEGRGIQNIQMDKINGHHQQQTQGHNKYYMRYLSAMAGPNSMAQIKQGNGRNSTPLAAGTRQADSAHSNTAFENWKSKQQDRLDKQKLIEEVLSSSAYTNELKTTLENLRRDIKEALGSQIANEHEKVNEVQEIGLNQELLHQLVDGQREMQEQLRNLRMLWNQALSQQQTEMSELKMLISSLCDQFNTTVQITLSNQLAGLCDTLNPSFQKLEIHLSAVSELLKSQCNPVQQGPDVRIEGCRAEHSFDADHQLTSVTDACVPTLHNTEVTPPNVCTREENPSSQPRSYQVIRKRKGQREPTSARTSVSNAVSFNEDTDGETSTTPCDIDLTQHSPLDCSQIITDSVQGRANSSQQRSSWMKNIPQITRPEAIFSPPRSPKSKKKKCGGGGKVRRQKRATKKIVSAPRVTRRSERLSKPSATIPTVRPSRTTQDDENIPGEDGEELRGESNRDVLDDWLDFRPQQDSQSEVKTASRFQRSSEAARRKMMVTEQMSTTMAARDTVLRELLSSTPSILSP